MIRLVQLTVRQSTRPVLVVIISLTLIGCTTSSNEAGGTASTVASSEGTEPTTGADLGPATDDDPDTQADDADGSDRSDAIGEPSSNDDVTVIDDPEQSEEAADEPIIPADEIIDTEVDETVEAPQANVAVSASALCATLQIGRDAVADGNDALAVGKRDALIDRASRVDDSQLADILARLDAGQPLSLSIAEQGLDRCQALGFEL